MREKTIGNYLCEEAGDDRFYLMHTIRKKYISDKEGNRIAFKDARRYSALSGSFVVELLSGEVMLIDDNGICLDKVFDEIGYECGTDEHHRPVKFVDEDNVWTYCIRTETGTELMYHDLCSGTRADEEVRLGDKLGNGIYYCLEHYPKEGLPYKTLGFVDNKTLGFLRKEIPNFKFSTFQVVPGKLECIIGMELGGKTIVLGPMYTRSLVASFDKLLSHSPDGKYWAGIVNDEVFVYDFYRKKRYKKDTYGPCGFIKYNQELNLFLLYTLSSSPRVYDI